MLFPSKHSKPDQTVLAVATLALRYLMRRQVASFDDVVKHCGNRVPHVEYLFSSAVSLLFMLGLIEYLPKADSFRIVRIAE